ncbi:hypothetical protein HETIRDRAFT_437461, partial [Heterobasidion irregulare TC 32-1]
MGNPSDPISMMDSARPPLMSASMLATYTGGFHKCARSQGMAEVKHRSSQGRLYRSTHGPVPSCTYVRSLTLCHELPPRNSLVLCARPFHPSSWTR